MPRFLLAALLAVLMVGCGGGGHASVRESYVGSYAVRRGGAGGAIVLDVVGGEAEGSIAAGGAVYDFAGRIGTDGELAATGNGIVVQAHLVPVAGGMGGTLSLSGAVSVEGAQTSLSRAEGSE